jgi:23S rRNA pseudouridine1911/1915/1917 synthase
MAVSRTITVTQREAGQTVAAVLRAHLRLSWSDARRLVETGQVRLGGAPCPDSARRVRSGQRLQVQAPGTNRGAKTKPRHDKPPSVSRRREHRASRSDIGDRQPAILIRYADDHLVVVDKPAGLTTMRHAHETKEFGPRARRYLPPTLADLLPDLLAEQPGGPRPHVQAVHRLDKETSGLVVFARTAQAARHLGKQFRAHTVARRYLAVVRGRAQSATVESFLVEDRGDGRRGSSIVPGQGQRAVTHVRVVEELGAFTLVECRLETGRTHQVRIHLAEQGTPLCGERVYDRPLHGRPLPDTSGALRPALHAAHLGLEHPATGQHLAWTSPLPPDLRDLVNRLRGGARGEG